MKTGLDVSAYLRRLGVKGAEGKFELVPGLFPVVDLGRADFLVDRPDYAYCFGGVFHSIPAAVIWDFSLYPNTQPCAVEKIRIDCSSTLTRWKLHHEAATFAPGGSRVDFGTLAGTAGVVDAAGAGPLGEMLGACRTGEIVLDGLDIRIEPGYRLLIQNEAIGALISQTAVSFWWREIPGKVIEP